MAWGDRSSEDYSEFKDYSDQADYSNQKTQTKKTASDLSSAEKN